ncbi:aldehyde dehydrogenase [Salinibacterium sp. M195]|uniref:aldehyde dehydrogenase family protein n=1 Tax=Salinibacterium sp. M195 TaxID=2583374 RepID=UPI001C62B0C5|nr:aldehyde dehydrogenase family protein [Salinibacterium sp. M195]QYH35465.1 aldehyde dehydrogenase [Salinibacterium sp. M195]
MSDKLLHWIDNEQVDSADGASVTTHSPVTGEPMTTLASGGEREVSLAVAAASAAAPLWRNTDAKQRGRLLHALSVAIRENSQSLADDEIAETGKPRSTALSEIANSADYFEYYAALVHLPAGEVINTKATEHTFTIREPIGVVAVITPWNVPLNQAARACAPALAAGNTVVIKPAEVTSRTTIRLAKLMGEVGIPAGVFNVVLGKGSVAGDALVRQDAVRKVAFTGSVGVGRLIGKIAADRIIPVTLELGGKSANIVFADADLDAAASETVRAFTSNAGQVCSAGTRLLVQSSIREEFLAKVVEQARTLSLGSDVGPLITRDQYLKVQEHLNLAPTEHAETLLGGIGATSDNAVGNYIPPTIYATQNSNSRIATEEIFGPVLVAITFESDEEAIRITNDSDYGLIAGVWTRDISRALTVARSLEVGQVFVNTWSTGAVETPFGGVKESGYGREKGIEALHHYTQLKCVVIATV